MLGISLPLEQKLAQKNLLKIVIQKLKDDYRPSCGTPPRIPTPRVVKAEDSGRPGVHGQAYGGSSSRVSSSTRAGSEVLQGTQSSSAYTSRSSSSSRRSSEGSQGTQSSSGSSRTSSSSQLSSGGSSGYQSSNGSSRTSSSSQFSSGGSSGYQSSNGSVRTSASSQRSSGGSQGYQGSRGSTPRSSSSSRRSSESSLGSQASQRSANSTLGDDACIVCMDNLANAVLAPCGHHNLCMGCAERLRSKICPTCRAPFSMIIKKVG